MGKIKQLPTSPAHTPAPWAVHVLERTNGDTVFEIERQSDPEHHIADAFTADDASLIAAAPELLDAVQDFCLSLETLYKDHLTIAGEYFGACLKERAEDAIFKAKA